MGDIELQGWAPRGGEQRPNDAESFEASKKVACSPEKREQEHTMAVYGETGEIAMNDGRIKILSIPLFAATGRVSTAIV
ncbi:hypothetical protein [Rhizobium leguminosarum]|uniref:hypothetical protein n=1 Tax=Rhizobium leguminosarum TaxID=384 RepID=UPI00396568D8